MKKSTIPYNVVQLKKMFEKSGILDFDCPIQRRYGSWDDFKKSLLIHSILVGYIVPPIYLTKENKGTKDAKNRPVSNYSCIDGQHRLLTLFDFLNDEFALHDDTPDAEIDGENFSIAGCKFSELPEEVQMILRTYTFTVYNLEEYTDEEIEEMFFRLNNGAGLSKTQIANVKLGMKLAKFVKEMVNRKFFTEVCHFTGAQYRRAADEKTFIQSMMLLDVKDGDYELTSISEGCVISYAESLHDNYSDAKCERLEKIMDYLEEGFDGKEKFMKVINIPMFIYMADEAINSGITPSEYYSWFEQFAGKYSPDCKYAENCGTGSIKKDKVNGRITVLKEDFEQYFAEELEAENEKEMEESTV